MDPTEPLDFAGDPISGSEATTTAAAIAGSYYEFGEYVSKTRMLTFWHQLEEVLATKPNKVLEIGIGPRVVAGTLRELGVDLVTLDVNEALSPNLVGSLAELDAVVEENSFDTVLCARVLHHLSFSDFDKCLGQLARAARTAVIITLPVDEVRVYAGFRRTGGVYSIGSLALPRALKSVAMRLFGGGEARYRQLWKVGSHSETSLKLVESAVRQHFVIRKRFTVPEDQSHLFFVLEPRV